MIGLSFVPMATILPPRSATSVPSVAVLLEDHDARRDVQRGLVLDAQEAADQVARIRRPRLALVETDVVVDGNWPRIRIAVAGEVKIVAVGARGVVVRPTHVRVGEVGERGAVTPRAHRRPVVPGVRPDRADEARLVEPGIGHDDRAVECRAAHDRDPVRDRVRLVRRRRELWVDVAIVRKQDGADGGGAVPAGHAVESGDADGAPTNWPANVPELLQFHTMLPSKITWAEAGSGAARRPARSSPAPSPSSPIPKRNFMDPSG